MKKVLNPSPDGFFYCQSCNDITNMQQIGRGLHAGHLLRPVMSFSWLQKMRIFLGMYE